MVDRPGSTPALLTLAVRLVGIAGRLVPTALRSDWEQEWHAELWHLYRSLEVQGRVSAYNRATFVLRSVGSILDAIQLRLGDPQPWGESFRAVVNSWGQRPGSVTMGLLVLSVGIAADSLLLACAQVMVEDPHSVWGSLGSGTRFLILGVAITCGISMMLASAAAAAQLLGSTDRSRADEPGIPVVETLLIAGITGWVGRWCAAVRMRTETAPPFAEWLASEDLGTAVTSAWVVSWIAGLTLLTILRGRRVRRRPTAELPG
jgi:hypothetical protein